jgi:hypothetical protein
MIACHAGAGPGVGERALSSVQASGAGYRPAEA